MSEGASPGGSKDAVKKASASNATLSPSTAPDGKKKKGSKWAAFGRFIFDPATKTVFGRSGKNWVQITIFYIIFYVYLFSFFFACLMALIKSLPYAQPLLTIDHYPYILSGAAGLSFYPRPIRPNRTESAQKSEVVSPVIWYDEDIEATWKVYTENNTNRNSLGKHANGGIGACTAADNFGYDKGMPCVAVRFNNIEGLKVKPMTQFKDGRSKAHLNYFENYKKNAEKMYEANKNNVGILCTGDGPQSNITMGNLQYMPQAGFITTEFNYPQKPLSFVFVKFMNPMKNTLIVVRCKVFEPSLDLEYQKIGLGSVQFGLFIQSRGTKTPTPPQENAAGVNAGGGNNAGANNAGGNNAGGNNGGGNNGGIPPIEPN